MADGVVVPIVATRDVDGLADDGRRRRPNVRRVTLAFRRIVRRLERPCFASVARVECVHSRSAGDEDQPIHDRRCGVERSRVEERVGDPLRLASVDVVGEDRLARLVGDKVGDAVDDDRCREFGDVSLEE